MRKPSKPDPSGQSRPAKPSPKRTRGTSSQRTRREERLLRLARALREQRDAALSQIESVCGQFARGYEDMSTQLASVATASEVRTLLGQELDVESVLRTSLEYLLRRVGPSNAAIYLPNDSGDFTLGAYINYDCPRDIVEATLDHLGDALVPLHAESPGLARIGPGDSCLTRLASPWLNGCSMLVHSAHAEGECRSLVCVFRDARTGFSPEASDLVRTLGSLLGEQLSRIVRTHHRMHKAA